MRLPLPRLTVLLAALVLLASACASEAGGGGGVGGGSALPEDPLELPEHDLASYEALVARLDRPAVVNIWASWCGPCEAEAPHLAAAHEEFGDRIQFIGVDILDDRTSARAFIERYGWDYPHLFDQPAAIRDGLGFFGQPVTIFYDAAGNQVDVWHGPIGPEQLEERIREILV